MLGHVDCSSTDTLLYEKVTSLAEKMQKNRPGRPTLGNNVRLHLWHPRTPNAQPFLEALKHEQRAGIVTGPACHDTPQARRLLIRLMERAEIVLKLNAHQEDLEWLQKVKHELEKAYAQEWHDAPEKTYRRGVKYHSVTDDNVIAYPRSREQ